MTTNANGEPNHLLLSNNPRIGYRFGHLSGPLTPVNLAGSNHEPHVTAHFTGGLCVELDVDTATALYQQLPGVLARMGIIPDVAGIVSEVGE